MVAPSPPCQKKLYGECSIDVIALDEALTLILDSDLSVSSLTANIQSAAELRDCEADMVADYLHDFVASGKRGPSTRTHGLPEIVRHLRDGTKPKVDRRTLRYKLICLTMERA